MKKIFFSLVFLASVFLFAENNSEVVIVELDNYESVSLSDNYGLSMTMDFCTVSCYANIYYNGNHVHTINTTASGSDCAIAQVMCMQNAMTMAQQWMQDQDPSFDP